MDWPIEAACKALADEASSKGRNATARHAVAACSRSAGEPFFEILPTVAAGLRQLQPIAKRKFTAASRGERQIDELALWGVQVAKGFQEYDHPRNVRTESAG